MNEILKDTLEYLNGESYYTAFLLDDGDDTPFKLLTKEETKSLLDYITNLQTIEQQYSALLSENADLQEELKGYKQERENLFKTTHDLQKENKRLKELCKEYKENHKAVCIQRDNILDNIVKNTEERIDYKSRCEKAVEYINHEIFKRTILVGVDTKKYTRNILDNVLNILNGGENND